MGTASGEGKAGSGLQVGVSHPPSDSNHGARGHRAGTLRHRGRSLMSNHSCQDAILIMQRGSQGWCQRVRPLSFGYGFGVCPIWSGFQDDGSVPWSGISEQSLVLSHIAQDPGVGGRVLAQDVRCPWSPRYFNGGGGVSWEVFRRVAAPQCGVSCLPASCLSKLVQL